MSRILLLVLLLIGAVVLVPSLRERARPHLQFAFDPFYEWSARNRVNEIADLLKRQQQLGRPLPGAREFPAFVEREDFQENASIDPWGRPYYLQLSRAGYQVGSAGKDGRRGSADDILSREERRADAGRRRR